MNKYIYIILTFSISVIFLSPVYSQLVTYPVRRCGTQELLRKKFQHDSAFLKKWESQQYALKEYITGNRLAMDDTTVYSIPVVVHIIHNNFIGDVSDSAVYSQMEILNNDYRKNPGTMGFNNNPVGADTKIVFCLAQKDPNGNVTTGIIRIQDTTASFNNDFDSEIYLKKLSYWDSKKYMNVWVCNLGSGLLGFGTFPGGDPKTDGIVINYKAFGAYKNTFSPYNYGRTTTHEVGHYLNLFHPWGDNAGDCSDDDGISDTPLCSGEFTADKDSNCKAPIQCGVKRQVENYMDYSDDYCMKMFSKGQATVMRSAISNFRPQLVSSSNLTATGIESGCGFILDVPEFFSVVNRKRFSVYPNPSTGEFILSKVNGQPFQRITLKIYNYLGQLTNMFFYEKLSEMNIKFEVEGQSGIYFINVLDGNENYFIPVVKY